MDLLAVIEEAVTNNQAFRGESQAEYIHRYIRPYVITREEFNSLQQEVEDLDKGCWVPDEGVDEDDVAHIAKSVFEEEVHIEEIRKMYSEIKKMHQELIDKQGVL